MRRGNSLIGGWMVSAVALLWFGAASAPHECFAESYNLSFSTYFGGSVRSDTARDVAVDGQGNNFRVCALGPDGSFVIVGSTESLDWPVLGAFQSSFAGADDDVVVVKFAPIPEPNTVSLLLVGTIAAGLVGLCRRRRAAGRS